MRFLFPITMRKSIPKLAPTSLPIYSASEYDIKIPKKAPSSLNDSAWKLLHSVYVLSKDIPKIPLHKKLVFGATLKNTSIIVLFIA